MQRFYRCIHYCTGNAEDIPGGSKNGTIERGNKRAAPGQEASMKGMVKMLWQIYTPGTEDKRGLIGTYNCHEIGKKVRCRYGAAEMI